MAGTAQRPMPQAVDTDDPVAISHRLGEIENELAVLQPELSRAAHWRKKYLDEIARFKKSLRPQGDNKEEREHHLHGLLEEAHGDTLDSLQKAEAQWAELNSTFEVLDTRRSILQSILKTHLREQEPKHGEGSHHRG